MPVIPSDERTVHVEAPASWIVFGASNQTVLGPVVRGVPNAQHEEHGFLFSAAHWCAPLREADRVPWSESVDRKSAQRGKRSGESFETFDSFRQHDTTFG
jgi:hypothetical protein